jgi:outer membrane receptor protein involved in Fe transport
MRRHRAIELITVTGVLYSTAATSAWAQATDTNIPVIVINAPPQVSRDTIPPAQGTNDYTLDQGDIDHQPQGEERRFDQTLLQAPGFAQDSFGQVHLRNEHANLQFRIDDIILPAGLQGFGQTFDSRFIDRVEILDGPLTARYGLQTSGVVNLTTKSGAFSDGGTIDLYGGGQQTFKPSIQLQGNNGNGLNYYASGTCLTSDEGIENPTASYKPIHDRTGQGHVFAYVEQALSDTTTLSAITGSASSQFQIPDNPGQPQQYQVAGVHSANSANLNQRQTEYNDFELLALKGLGDDYTWQAAPFVRYSQTNFTPDAVGDLAFNGVADHTQLFDVAKGVQFDATYQVNADHRLGAGLIFQSEHTGSGEAASVFANTTGAANIYGNAQDSLTPETIEDDSGKTGYTYGVYAQDEWRMSEQVTLNYGLRFDQVQAYTGENQISPRINMVYKPFDGTALHAGYARDFTPPPQELVATPSLAKFAGTTQAAAVTDSGPVRAEREHSFDAGGTQQILQGWNIGLDGYYKIKRNLLDEGQFGESLVFSPFNYAVGRAYGIEGTTSLHYGAFSAYGNLAYGEEKGKDIDSGQFFFTQAELTYIASHAIYTDHSQKVTASAGTSYKFEDEPGLLTPSLDMVFGSGLRADPGNGVIEPNGVHLPPYAAFNLGITQTMDKVGGWGKGVTLRMDIVNLTDRIYELRDGTGVGVGAPQYGERRTVFFGVAKKF